MTISSMKYKSNIEKTHQNNEVPTLFDILRDKNQWNETSSSFSLNDEGKIKYQQEIDISPLIKHLRDTLCTYGAKGIHGLSRHFRIMDIDGNRTLSREEFSTALSLVETKLTQDNINQLFDYFDRNGSNSIDFNEFLNGIREPMNSRRLALVKKAFDLIDADGNGLLEVSDIITLYDASKHPQVISGQKKERQVFEEFLETFDVDGYHNGIIKLEEWEHYYHNVSASIDNDDFFELMMRNAWRMSGGSGWCENTANRRICVEDENYQEKVVEIEHNPFQHPVKISSPIPVAAGKKTSNNELKTKRINSSHRNSHGIHGVFSSLSQNNIIHNLRTYLNTNDWNYLYMMFTQSPVEEIISWKKIIISIIKKENDLHPELNKQQMLLLLNNDKYADVSMTKKECFSLLFSSLSSMELEQVNEIFYQLDFQKNGYLNAQDLIQAFDVSQHPYVVQKKKTPSQVLKDFILHLRLDENPYKTIFLEQWIQYFKLIHQCMNMKDFHDMIKKVWIYPSPSIISIIENNSKDVKTTDLEKQCLTNKNEQFNTKPFQNSIMETNLHELKDVQSSTHAIKLFQQDQPISKNLDKKNNVVVQDDRKVSQHRREKKHWDHGVKCLIDRIRLLIKERHEMYGYFYFRRTLLSHQISHEQDDFIKGLSLKQFISACQAFPLKGLLSSDFRRIFECFYPLKYVHIDAIMHLFREDLSSFRASVVDQIFHSIDGFTQNGILSFEIIHQHLSQDNIQKCLDINFFDKDQEITFDYWKSWFADLSAAIESDLVFLDVLKTSFGKSINTTQLEKTSSMWKSNSINLTSTNEKTLSMHPIKSNLHLKNFNASSAGRQEIKMDEKLLYDSKIITSSPSAAIESILHRMYHRFQCGSLQDYLRFQSNSQQKKLMNMKDFIDWIILNSPSIYEFKLILNEGDVRNLFLFLDGLNYGVLSTKTLFQNILLYYIPKNFSFRKQFISSQPLPQTIAQCKQMADTGKEWIETQTNLLSSWSNLKQLLFISSSEQLEQPISIAQWIDLARILSLFLPTDQEFISCFQSILNAWNQKKQHQNNEQEEKNKKMILTSMETKHVDTKKPLQSLKIIAFDDMNVSLRYILNRLQSYYNQDKMKDFFMSHHQYLEEEDDNNNNNNNEKGSVYVDKKTFCQWVEKHFFRVSSLTSSSSTSIILSRKELESLFDYFDDGNEKIFNLEWFLCCIGFSLFSFQQKQLLLDCWKNFIRPYVTGLIPKNVCIDLLSSGKDQMIEKKLLKDIVENIPKITTHISLYLWFYIHQQLIIKLDKNSLLSSSFLSSLWSSSSFLKSSFNSNNQLDHEYNQLDQLVHAAPPAGLPTNFLPRKPRMTSSFSSSTCSYERNEKSQQDIKSCLEWNPSTNNSPKKEKIINLHHHHPYHSDQIKSCLSSSHLNTISQSSSHVKDKDVDRSTSIFNNLKEICAVIRHEIHRKNNPSMDNNGLNHLIHLIQTERIKSKGDGMISFDQLNDCLQKCHVQIPIHTLKMNTLLSQHKKFPVAEMIEWLQGKCQKNHPHVLELIQQAFQALQKDKDNHQVTPLSLAQSFDVMNHPLVKYQLTTPKEVFYTFVSNFDVNNRLEETISYKEFENYCLNWFAGIGDETYFEILLKSVFHF